MLKKVVKEALHAFEKATSEEIERIYDEISGLVTDDKTLHKFWQLHRAIHCLKKFPDFRR